MSTKANTSSRQKKEKRTHEHLTLSKTGYIPTGTDKKIDIKIAKKG